MGQIASMYVTGDVHLWGYGITRMRVPACEQDGVFGGPPSGIRVIIPIAEAYQPGVCVIQAACEAEGYFEVRVDDVAEGIILNTLHRIAGRI